MHLMKQTLDVLLDSMNMQPNWIWCTSCVVGLPSSSDPGCHTLGSAQTPVSSFCPPFRYVRRPGTWASVRTKGLGLIRSSNEIATTGEVLACAVPPGSVRPRIVRACWCTAKRRRGQLERPSHHDGVQLAPPALPLRPRAQRRRNLATLFVFGQSPFSIFPGKGKRKESNR